MRQAKSRDDACLLQEARMLRSEIDFLPISQIGDRRCPQCRSSMRLVWIEPAEKPGYDRRTLISYAPDRVEQFRRAAGYVDRILRGEKAADLPVQAPTKLELTINLRTAKALGLAVPPAVLARADEVIE